MTPTEQLARFYWMLEVCARNGWVHLAALVQQQIDAIEGRNG
jgi:hypothetical protein